MKFLLLGIFIIMTVFSDLKAQSKASLRLEPIYGIETALVQEPQPPRYKTRAVYGGRALYGVTLLSAEAEYTTSQSREDYPVTYQVVNDKTERFNLGLRSTYGFNNFLGAYIRGGGSASRGETVIKTAGVEDRKERALTLNPYAGAGLQFAFSSMLALNAGATLIRNIDNQYDAQYTLGLSARFGRP